MRYGGLATKYNMAGIEARLKGLPLRLRRTKNRASQSKAILAL